MKNRARVTNRSRRAGKLRLSVAVLCAGVLILVVGGYACWQWYRSHEHSERQLAAWQAEQQFEGRLDGIVEMKFRRTPSLQEWLQEWSRQAKIGRGMPELAGFHPNEQTPVELTLPPITARDALRSLARSYHLHWSVRGDEILLTTKPYQPEVRRHRLPDSLRHLPIELALNRYLRHLGGMIVDRIGDDIQLVAPRSAQVEAEAFLNCVALGMARAAENRGDRLAINSAACEPILVDADPPAVEQALATLRRPVERRLAAVPLDKFAAAATSSIGLPVLVDEAMSAQGFITVTEQNSERLKAKTFEQFALERGLKALPVGGGRAIRLIANQDADLCDRLTMIYPAPDLIRPSDSSGEWLARLVASLTPGPWYDLATREREGIDVCGPLLIVTAEPQTHVVIQRLLQTMRAARGGLQGSCVRGEAYPEAANRIEQALEQPAKLEFVGVSLQHVLADIARRFDVPIEIDGFIGDAGISEKTPFWCHLPAAPLGENLQRILEPLRLTFGVQRDVLLVISQLDALVLRSEPQFQYEVFNLRALTTHNRQVPGQMIDALLTLDDGFEWQRTGGRGRATAFGSLLVFHNHEACLNRLRRTFQAIERQYTFHPDDVRERALRTDSAPFDTDPSTTGRAAQQAREQALRQALAQPVTVQFKDCTMSDGLLKLAREHNLPIVLNTTEITELMDPERVSVAATAEPLIGVLERLVVPWGGKKWTIRDDGTLQLSSPGRTADRHGPETWRFDVSDLVTPNGKLPIAKVMQLLLLHASSPASSTSLVRIEPHLDRFITVHATPSDCRAIQATLHSLRLGKLPTLAPKSPAADGAAPAPDPFQPQ